ncbi:uncharacterized protein DC041_0006852 [Schistosoma bovis]|uniref:Uncharacterized protein n=1 Tax=Schistosoma bovis TaxID=6184 RepID=A0A430QFC8_SCHBO|nr:uncharacterized protein DC041_0006852 [Schistosoma bovis]
MSIFGAKYVLKLFKKYKGEFLRAGFAGVDMNKPSKPTIPEAQGVICGVVFLSIMFLFIPVPFWRYLVGKADVQSLEVKTFFLTNPTCDRYDPADGLLHPSRVRFHPKSLSRLGQFVLTVFSYVGIIECKLCPDCIPNISTLPTTGMIVSQQSHENMSSDEEQTSERRRARSRSPVQTKLPTEEIVEVDNLTVINMMLRVLGPRNEQQTTNTLLLLQILCSCFAFMIRYPLAWLFYDVPAK